MKQLRLVLSVSFAASLAQGMLACEDGPLVKQCRRYCGQNFCDSDVDAEAYPDCWENCAERQDAAAAHSKDCRDATGQLLDCINALDCEGAGLWKLLRAEDVDHPCKAENSDFLATCPGVWFAPE